MVETKHITGVTYPPVGRCIYCGAVRDLSDEHIIAYALAGTAVLPEASCTNCAVETGRIEQRCCRVNFDHIRYPLKMPSRKGKGRRGSLPILYRSTDGQLLRTYIATADHPLGLCLPIWNPPRILEGWAEFEPTIVHLSYWRFGPPTQKFETTARALTATGIAARFDVPSMARMLAKIGHSYAVADVGLDRFTPLAVELILGKSNNWGHWVGRSQAAPDRSIVGNELHFLMLSTRNVDGVDYLVVTVQLFSRFGAPLYDVAVGRLTPEQLERLRAD